MNIWDATFQLSNMGWTLVTYSEKNVYSSFNNLLHNFIQMSFSIIPWLKLFWSKCTTVRVKKHQISCLTNIAMLSKTSKLCIQGSEITITRSDSDSDMDKASARPPPKRIRPNKRYPRGFRFSSQIWMTAHQKLVHLSRKNVNEYKKTQLFNKV